MDKSANSLTSQKRRLEHRSHKGKPSATQTLNQKRTSYITSSEKRSSERNSKKYFSSSADQYQKEEKQRGLTSYFALVRKEEGSCFGIEFPDFPGCISAADHLQDAVDQAVQALTLHIEGMIEDGESIPLPTPLDRVLQMKNAKNALFLLVPVPTTKSKTIRLSITMDELFLQSVDKTAAYLGLSRSAFLAHAARQSMA